MSKPHTGPALPADRLHLLPRHREMLLALLREHLPGIEVWAYGSRVNGQSHDGSDLDLVLRSPDLQEIPIGRVGDFWEALRESNIPFLVEARDWARLPEGFHREIERGYVVLVEKEDGNTAGKRQEVALGELVEIYDGPHATPKKTDAGPIFLGISNLASGRLDLGKTEHLSEEDYKRWTQRVTPEPGDTVFSYETRLGEAAHIPTGLRCCLGRRMGLLRPKEGRIDARFLLYAFLGERFQEVLRSRTIHGSTVNRIPLTEMGSFPIAIPTDLSEQRAIAHILGTLDDKIELNRRMNETLETMTRALFKSWFVDFDPVHAKAALKHHAANQIPRQGNSTRATKATPSDHSPLEGESARQGGQPAVEPVGGNQTPLPLLKGSDWTAERAQAYLAGMEPEIAALFPDSFAASELGPIPAGWEVRPLAECIDVIRGLSYQGSKLADTGLPMHNLNSIYEGGGYKQAGIKYYAGDFKDRHTTHPGDLLVANTEQGHDRLLIGYAAIVPSRSGATSLFSHHLYRLRLSPNLTPDYLCHLLNTQRMHDRVSSYATGTTVNMLPLDALRLPRVVVPCGPLVTAFDRAAKAARERQEQIVEEVHTLTALRDTLLPKLVSGKLRIEAPQGFSTEFHDG